MIDIKTLSTEKIDELIQHLNAEIEDKNNISENKKKLMLLQSEKKSRKKKVWYSPHESQQIEFFKEVAPRQQNSELPQAIVVKDIMLTTNTVNIKVDEVMQNGVHLNSAFAYHKEGHLDYSKLSKIELEAYMDAYAELVVQGIDIEQSEAILEDLIVIYVERFEDVPTKTISIVREEIWDDSLKDKVGYRTETIIKMPTFHENEKKVRGRPTTKDSLAQGTELKSNSKKFVAIISISIFIMCTLTAILIYKIMDTDKEEPKSEEPKAPPKSSSQKVINSNKPETSESIDYVGNYSTNLLQR